MFRFAGNDERIGVAISRMAACLATALERILNAQLPLRPLVDKKILVAVDAEARDLLPHLKACCVQRCFHALKLSPVSHCLGRAEEEVSQ